MSSVGVVGMVLSTILAVVVVFAKITGKIVVPGYSATALLIVFFGGLNSLGIGLIGEYLWRTFENTKDRPQYVIAQHHEFKADRRTIWIGSSNATLKS